MKSANKVHLSPRQRRPATTNGHWPTPLPPPLFSGGEGGRGTALFTARQKKKMNKDTRSGKESVSNFSLWRINLDSWPNGKALHCPPTAVG